MTEKGCDNCYYTYFDERAYPCSLCIRGIERTDMWQPSKKTKATISKMEQVDKDINVRSKTEPQTMYYPQVDGITPSVIVKDEPQTEDLQDWKDRMWAEAVIEPQTDIGTSDTVYSDTAGYVPRADMTDCSWK